ncbi:MAG: hypothetical protein WCT28_04260 [Patescibacteria group bacterium]|jgi:hypothetical protein
MLLPFGTNPNAASGRKAIIQKREESVKQIPSKIQRTMLRAFDRAQKRVERHASDPDHEIRARALLALWVLSNNIVLGNITEVPYDVVPSELRVANVTPELRIFYGGWNLFKLFEALQDLVEWRLDPSVATTAQIQLKFSAIEQRKYEEREIDIIFPHIPITPAARRAILAQNACTGIRGWVVEKINNTRVTMTGASATFVVRTPSNVRFNKTSSRWDVVSS